MSTHLHVSFDIADTESNQNCQMLMREKNWSYDVASSDRWVADLQMKLIAQSGASTPYKRWSKCTMEKVGGTFLQKLRGEVH